VDGWRIFYADGSTFSEEDGPPEDAPPVGVQIIVQPHPVTGAHVLEGADYYIRHGGEWVGCDLPGLLDHLARTVKRGLSLDTATYQDILGRALAEYDRRKSAWLPSERKA
jgi:hypothetical protein